MTLKTVNRHLGMLRRFGPVSLMAYRGVHRIFVYLARTVLMRFTLASVIHVTHYPHIAKPAREQSFRARSMGEKRARKSVRSVLTSVYPVSAVSQH